MLRRAHVLLGLATAGLLLGGCYAGTEPATEVTSSGATLNAQGTADDGTAFSFFEYGPSGVAAAQRRTVERRWPAGASGPIREAVQPLYAGTTYAFRVCGHDEGEPVVCAQTRTFTTSAPTRDAVRGRWQFGPASPHSVTGSVDASTLGFRTAPMSTLYFGGDVTCLQVTGRRAAVGAVGEVREAVGGGRRPARALVSVVDGGPGQVDRVRQTYELDTTTPPSCSTAATPTADEATAYDDLVVYDAP